MNESQTVANNRVTCLYCRVSTNDQKFGLESQIRTLKEYCEKNKYTNFELYTDEGISGAKSSRPSLDRMMNLVEQGKVERVIVYSFSRFARSVTHLLSALEKFKEKNVAFVSYTEAVETNSPMGKLFFLLIAGLAQLERELIVERVKNGLRNAKLKGIHIGRKKTRPSELIRQLLKKGLPYRTIASITGSSSGSINAERKEMLKEEADIKLKREQELIFRAHEAERKLKAQNEADLKPLKPSDLNLGVLPGFEMPKPNMTVTLL